MGRPQTATDDDILEAAKQVFMRRGPDAFTMAEVASEVGLSRAAIILRFESTQALKRTLFTQMSDELIEQLEQLPRTPGGDNLLGVASCIAAYAGNRQGAGAFFSTYSSNAQDRKLLELERRRGEALCNAVSRVMPKVTIDHAAAVAIFVTHLAGCMVSWIGLDDDDPRAYLRMRTKEWLRLAGIPFSDAATAGGSSGARRTRAKLTRPRASRRSQGSAR